MDTAVEEVKGVKSKCKAYVFRCFFVVLSSVRNCYLIASLAYPTSLQSSDFTGSSDISDQGE